MEGLRKVKNIIVFVLFMTYFHIDKMPYTDVDKKMMAIVRRSSKLNNMMLWTIFRHGRANHQHLKH